MQRYRCPCLVGSTREQEKPAHVHSQSNRIQLAFLLCSDHSLYLSQCSRHIRFYLTFFRYVSVGNLPCGQPHVICPLKGPSLTNDKEKEKLWRSSWDADTWCLNIFIHHTLPSSSVLSVWISQKCVVKRVIFSALPLLHHIFV